MNAGDEPHRAGNTGPHVVVLSSLFPSGVQPVAGLFIRERMFRVGEHLPLAVVAPSAWFPLQGLLRRWRPGFRPGAPRHEKQQGYDVWFPRFLSVVFEFNWFWLASPEGNDASDGIVRRDADGHAISRDNFDAEAAHSAAELGEHFVPSVALYPVEASTVHRDDRALHIDEIVLTQTASNPFMFLTSYCVTRSLGIG